MTAWCKVRRKLAPPLLDSHMTAWCTLRRKLAPPLLDSHMTAWCTVRRKLAPPYLTLTIPHPLMLMSDVSSSSTRITARTHAQQGLSQMSQTQLSLVTVTNAAGFLDAWHCRSY
jgi:hypothetical protein